MAEPRITMFEALAVEAELSLAAVEVIAERRAVTEALETTRVQAIEAAAHRGTLAEVERFARPQAASECPAAAIGAIGQRREERSGRRFARQARLSLILEILFYAGLEGYPRRDNACDNCWAQDRAGCPRPSWRRCYSNSWKPSATPSRCAICRCSSAAYSVPACFSST